MSRLPLIFSFGLFGFTITGPVHPIVTVFAGVVFGWCAGLSYAAHSIDRAEKERQP